MLQFGHQSLSHYPCPVALLGPPSASSSSWPVSTRLNPSRYARLTNRMISTATSGYARYPDGDRGGLPIRPRRCRRVAYSEPSVELTPGSVSSEDIQSRTACSYAMPKPTTAAKKGLSDSASRGTAR